jgi:hypothetical protein
MSQLPRQHAQLTTMVCFVSNEVAEEMHEVRGKVLPCSRRNCATTRHPKPDQLDDAFTAAPERSGQLRPPHGTAIN